jgi:DNA-binding response OmpR family regulator
MSGDEVAREVRNLGIQVYIVGCTGNALREDQDAYLDAGADDILPKPLHQADIVKRLNEATRRRRAKAATAVAAVSGEGGGTGS